MFIRIWKKDGTVQLTKANNAEEMRQIKIVAEKFGWKIDVIGKRPW